MNCIKFIKYSNKGVNMKIIKSKKLCKKLRNIEGELSDANSLIEVVRDSCSCNDYINQEFVINCALKKYNNVIENLSRLYV